MENTFPVSNKKFEEHIDNATAHVTTAEKNVWNNKSDFYAVSGVYTCTGDHHDSYIYVEHGESVAPIMVSACMVYDPYANESGLAGLHIAAGVPTYQRNMSTTHIWLLIPHYTTVAYSTKIRWTAIFGPTIDRTPPSSN